MNFEAAYLAALAALIVSLGGVVPTAPALNFRDSELAHLRAIVLAVGGTLPGAQLNYHDLVLANWRAAIVARGGTVPGVQLNFRLSHLLHVQAFQLALGNSVAFSGNYHEALLQLVRSPPLDPDVLTYVAAVEAVGGSVSTSAQSLLNTAITTTYGGLKYADYKAKLRFFWCPLSNFAGMRVPVKGSAFTNNNFVSGDYSINSGLQGGVSKYLDTGVAANSETDNNTTLMAGTVHTGNYSNWLIGGGNSAAFVAIGAEVDSYNNNPLTDGRIVLASRPSGFYFATRSSSSNFTVYRDKTLAGSKTGSTSIGTLANRSIFIANSNFSGSPLGATSGRVDSGSYGSALTQSEQDSFSDMLNAIRTGRASL
jgi:hypothetical protein